MTDQEKRTELIQSVKAYIGMTWSDPHMDARITESVASGIQYIEHLAYGQSLDFLVGTRARQLLMDYCFYAFNGKIDLFGIAYERDINTFQLEREVTADVGVSSP